MGKLLLFLSCVCLTILVIGTATMPQASAFWMASALPAYQVVRIILGSLLLMEFVTDPPRNRTFRIVAGLVSSAIAIWALDATYSNHMELLDSFSILSAACAIGVTALELKPEDAQVKTQNNIA